MFGKPIAKIFHYLFLDSRMVQRRLRAVGVTAAVSLLLLLLLFVIPFPRMTVAHGIFWAPESSRLIAGSNGFVDTVHVASGTEVKQGQLLLTSTNQELEASVARSAARLQELLARYTTAVASARQNEAGIIQEEIQQMRNTLSRAMDEKRRLTLNSHSDGVFQLALPVDPEARFIPRGTLIGYVLQPGGYHIRVVVGQDDVEAVRNDLKSVSIRLAHEIDTVRSASLVGEVPSASKELPSAALSVQGGGQFALDPMAQERPEAFDPVFIFDLLAPGLPVMRIGERVYVRFEHTAEPVGYRIYRQIRRTLLRELEF